MISCLPLVPAPLAVGPGHLGDSAVISPSHTPVPGLPFPHIPQEENP